jgi:hypothetical protein
MPTLETKGFAAFTRAVPTKPTRRVSILLFVCARPFAKGKRKKRTFGSMEKEEKRRRKKRRKKQQSPYLKNTPETEKPAKGHPAVWGP